MNDIKKYEYTICYNSNGTEKNTIVQGFDFEYCEDTATLYIKDLNNVKIYTFVCVISFSSKEISLSNSDYVDIMEKKIKNLESLNKGLTEKVSKMEGDIKAAKKIMHVLQDIKNCDPDDYGIFSRKKILRKIVKWSNDIYDEHRHSFGYIDMY